MSGTPTKKRELADGSPLSVAGELTGAMLAPWGDKNVLGEAEYQERFQQVEQNMVDQQKSIGTMMTQMNVLNQQQTHTNTIANELVVQLQTALGRLGDEHHQVDERTRQQSSDIQAMNERTRQQSTDIHRQQTTQQMSVEELAAQRQQIAEMHLTDNDRNLRISELAENAQDGWKAKPDKFPVNNSNWMQEFPIIDKKMHQYQSRLEVIFGEEASQ